MVRVWICWSACFQVHVIFCFKKEQPKPGATKISHRHAHFQESNLLVDLRHLNLIVIVKTNKHRTLKTRRQQQHPKTFKTKNIDEPQKKQEQQSGSKKNTHKKYTKKQEQKYKRIPKKTNIHRTPLQRRESFKSVPTLQRPDPVTGAAGGARGSSKN